MVFKKPYAFLIKHFKIIHLILLIFTIYITISFNRLVTFFAQFVNNGIFVNENAARSYFSILFILSIIVVITFSILMYALMHQKNKPSNFYLFSAIYYFLLLVATFYAYSAINDLVTTTITQQTALAYRDIYKILLAPNLYFLVISFIRGIGFDIKKFNFNKDLQELEIKSTDSEEFEFILGNDAYKYKRKFRRILRELKYYILENKIFISIILSAVLGVSLLAIVLNTTIFNRTYKIGSTMKTAGFTYKLNNAYISSYDYSGKEIKEGKKYLILDFNIRSTSNNPVIKPENFYIKKGKNVINFKTSLANSFSDLGITYNNNRIAKDGNNYLFIYEIDANTRGNTYILNVYDSIKYKNNGLSEQIYKKFTIKPQKLDNNYITKTKELNENFTLNNKLFGNTNITIKSAKISSSYAYEYQNCDNTANCQSIYDIQVPTNSNSNLLTLEYELNIDKDSILYNIVGDNDNIFFDRFLKVRYTINNQKYLANLSSIQNKRVNNLIFANISNTLNYASDIKIVISTRVSEYEINL